MSLSFPFSLFTAYLTDNDFSEFRRPEHYIRHIGMISIQFFFASFLIAHSLEPLESELAVQVEYDMDEQGELLTKHHAFTA